MNGLFKKKANLYTLIGALFGLLFPIMSSIIQCFLEFDRITLELLGTVQVQNPLLWVIDSAPFWLGIFARMAGIKQDEVLKEIHRSREIEEELRETHRIITNDFNMAKTVQESFLPDIPKASFADIDYRYLPVKSIGGDFLTFTEFQNEHLSVFIGDVSGHGISAAIINSFALAILSKLSHECEDSPAKYLTKYNNELIHILPANKFITAIFGMLKKETDRLLFTFARGGHPHPIVWRSSDNTAYMQESQGMALGYIENVEYKEISVPLFPGDSIFLYTDGITEETNTSGEEFGTERLLRTIEAACSREESVEEILDFILHKVILFSNDTNHNDDKIIICIRAV